MDWSSATWWWVATGVLVAAELATGTFYLLMLAIGTAAAALAAHAAAPFTGQLVAAALLGGGAVLAWYVKRSREPRPPSAAADRNVNLDVGERVVVTQWDADGSARVQYRGAAWSVRWVGTGLPQPGEHVIRAVDGNRLLLDRAAA
jgi:membrane protein implicated in regulation of membrane protease activity